MTKTRDKGDKPGVSVIVSTNKPNFVKNIFANFNNQSWTKKELIIILNNDLIELSKWKKPTETNKGIYVYQLPENESLGTCLNFAVNKANYDYVAKFDDDDYYTPFYLSEAMKVFQQTNADLVGKRSYYMYMVDKKLLMLRHPSCENRWYPLIAGGTIVAKKKVFLKVPFVNRKVGTAFQFVGDSCKKGFRIYSSSRFNYVYLRRDDRSHTWNPGIGYFSKTSKEVAYTSDYQSYASRPGKR